MPMLAGGAGYVGQAGDLGRALFGIFGSGQGAPGVAPGAAAAGGGWLSQHPVLAGAVGAGGLGGAYQAVTNPAAIGNALTWGAAHIPAIGVGAAALGAEQLPSRAGAAYQRSVPFVNALIQRGTQAADNPLVSYLGAGAAALPPDRQ
jgi:hypothetical protein